ncbi:MAG: class II aldolase/adducin family protein [Deltaproteobacteria bacterium]|nr:class II aldolase/adducin family protein [Deltaproteobacteria bacterium]
MTQRLREELVATARRMSDLGLTPGMSGNVSVRTPRGLLVTPSGMPYGELVADDAVEISQDGTIRPGQRSPTTEWQLHRDILGSRTDVQAIVHTHSLFCTTISTLRRPIPALHYMIVLAGGDEIPCADYATFGSAELASNAIVALGGGQACLLANHGMVALGASLPQALRLAAEVETLASQYWHAAQIGTPHILDRSELDKVRAKFVAYGQHKPRTRRSW